MPPDDGDVIRVLVADDHPVVRSGLVGVLSSLGGFEVVAVATDGHEAVRETVLHQPTSLSWTCTCPAQTASPPSAGGPGRAVRARVRAHDVRRRRLALRRVRAGAHGYLLKGAEQEDIARAVRAIAAGEAIFGPGIARRVLHRLTSPSNGATPNPFPDPRRGEGLQNPRVARLRRRPPRSSPEQLQVTPKTVSNHVSNILTKLRAADRTQAAMLARDAGLGRAAAQDPGRRDDRPSGRDGRGP